MSLIESRWLSRVSANIFQAVRDRVKRSQESGFTLIELMVVIVILGILFAIFIPTSQEVLFKAKVRAAVVETQSAIINAIANNPEATPTLAQVFTDELTRRHPDFRFVITQDVDPNNGILTGEFELWLPSDPLALPGRRLSFDWYSESGRMIIMTRDERG